MAVDILRKQGISTEIGLIGKFLSFSQPRNKQTEQEHCDEFFNWLKENGIKNNRHDIVLQISEKAKYKMRDINQAKKVSNIALHRRTNYFITFIFR